MDPPLIELKSDRLRVAAPLEARVARTAGEKVTKARCTTIRLKLLNIGARLRITVRRIWLSLSETCPYPDEFARLLAKLRSHPPRPAPVSALKTPITPLTHSAMGDSAPRSAKDREIRSRTSVSAQ